MKKNIYDTILRKCDSAAIKEINFGNILTIKHYWSARAGANGHQIHTVIHDWRTNPVTSHYHVSGGCGFNKESSEYWYALRYTGLMTREDRGQTREGDSISHKYHVGGNYYKVPKSHILKYK